jgi:hypothetical protein
LEGTWKEAAMVSLEILFPCFPEGGGGADQKREKRVRLSSDRDLQPGPSDYEVEMPGLWSRYTKLPTPTPS